jgi:hypothetical protein
LEGGMPDTKQRSLAKRFFAADSMAYYLAQGFGRLFKNAIVFLYCLYLFIAVLFIFALLWFLNLVQSLND